VEQNALVLDVGEEVMASDQGVVDRLDGLDDQVRPGADGESADAGLGPTPGVRAVDAQEQIQGQDYVSYAVGLTFEYPLGNLQSFPPRSPSL